VEAVADMIRILMDGSGLEQDRRPAVIAAETYVVGVSAVQQCVEGCPQHFELAPLLAPFGARGQPEADLLSRSRGDPSGEAQTVPTMGWGIDDAPETSKAAGPATTADAHRLAVRRRA